MSDEGEKPVQTESVPECGLSVSAHLPLQLEHTVKERLCCWWAAWDVDIHGHYTITSTNDGIRVVVVSTSVRT